MAKSIFMGQDFLLKSEPARKLYHENAEGKPIYDYHCHLSPKEIYEDKPFDNIADIWLGGDHYKWRAMRYAGVPEALVTGGGAPLEKFKAWARVCERLAGCPLYHWANLELQMYFGVTEPLKAANAERIYNQCNEKIRREQLSPVKLIERSNVKLVCTTDDPVDDLGYHQKLKAEKQLSFQMLPAFRPDKAVNLNNDGFDSYIQKLSQVAGFSIDSYGKLVEALSQRIDFFDAMGCRVSDHSIESLSTVSGSEAELEAIFARGIRGEKVSQEELDKYKNGLVKRLAALYAQKGWVMQLHIGAIRNNNLPMFRKLGPDTGYDSMNDFSIAAPLVKLMKEMHAAGQLPKTVLYTLNHKDNLVLSTIGQSYQEDGVTAKIQFGVPWWFNDHKDGIEEHLVSIANQGMLPEFIGMLTDSRSFLSYARHDYFRRILCNFLGQLVVDGEFEEDYQLLGGMVEDICHRNVARYLGLADETFFSL